MIMFDRRLVENFDWGLLLLILSLMGIGLLNIYSAVMAGNPDGVPHLFYRQIMWYGIGAGIMCVMMLFHYKLYEQWGISIFVGCILLLVMLFFVGKYVGGSRRWLALGPISIQPSEFGKLAIILYLGMILAKKRKQGLTASFRGFIPPATETMKPAGILNPRNATNCFSRICPPSAAPTGRPFLSAAWFLSWMTTESSQHRKPSTESSLRHLQVPAVSATILSFIFRNEAAVLQNSRRLRRMRFLIAAAVDGALKPF